VTPEPSDSDFTSRLSEAIKSYEASWKPVDGELYELCRRRARYLLMSIPNWPSSGGYTRLEWLAPGAAKVTPRPR
jgi:hypothetical protein